MSQINVELHEKNIYEHIPDWEHETVHEVMKKLGYSREAVLNGSEHHLTRACYFKVGGTSQDVQTAYTNIKAQLIRGVIVFGTIGISYGYGLKPVIKNPYGSLASFIAAPSTIPGLSVPISDPDWEKTFYGSLFGTSVKPK